MSKLIHRALVAFTFLAGCSAAAGTITGSSEPVSTFTVAGPENLTFTVDVLAVERTPTVASYQLTVEGERYALSVRDSEGGLSAEVRNATGALVLSGSRHGDVARVTEGTVDLQATGEPVEIDVSTMAGLDPYAVTLLTDDALRALAGVRNNSAATDGLGVQTAASIQTVPGPGVIVLKSKCSATCSVGGSCSVTCKTGNATCGCNAAGCTAYCAW